MYFIIFLLVCDTDTLFGNNETNYLNFGLQITDQKKKAKRPRRHSTTKKLH